MCKPQKIACANRKRSCNSYSIAATVLTERKTVVVICQVRAQSRVLKKWYGCSVAEQVTLIDLYNQYASGQLDNSEAIAAEFATSRG